MLCVGADLPRDADSTSHHSAPLSWKPSTPSSCAARGSPSNSIHLGVRSLCFASSLEYAVNLSSQIAEPCQRLGLPEVPVYPVRRLARRTWSYHSRWNKSGAWIAFAAARALLWCSSANGSGTGRGIADHYGHAQIDQGSFHCFPPPRLLRGRGLLSTECPCGRHANVGMRRLMKREEDKVRFRRGELGNRAVWWYRRNGSGPVHKSIMALRLGWIIGWRAGDLRDCAQYID